MSLQVLCHLNGIAHPQTDIHNRAQAYGDGVFETIRVLAAQAPLLPLHLARLKKGLDCLHIMHTTHTWQCIETFFTALGTQYDAADRDASAASGKVKILAYREAGGHGYMPLPQAQANILIFFEAASIDHWMQPAKKLIDAAIPLSTNTQLAKIKHLNRLDYILAASNTPVQPHESLLLYDAYGHIVESLHHNIFIVKDNCVSTPLLTYAGVEGVFKKFLMRDIFDSMGLTTQEKNIASSDIIHADAVFLTNALTGITPVTQYKNACFSADIFYKKLQYFIEKNIKAKMIKAKND